MDYCKITENKQAYIMPNPFKLVIANPSDAQKSLIAQLDNWLEMVYTDEPSYDPSTQYLVQYWEEENGKAVQHWEVKELPIKDATADEYDLALTELGASVPND